MLIAKASVNGRNEKYDYIAGILILAMLFSHLRLNCAHDTINSLVWLFYSRTIEMIIVPWFFFKSGMFFKDKSIKEVLIGGGKFIKPYVIFSLFGVVFNILYQLTINGAVDFDGIVTNDIKRFITACHLEENLPVWFLLSLWIVQIFFASLRKVGLSPMIIIFLTIIINTILLLVNHISPYIFSNVTLGLFFFSFGYLMKDLQYKNYVFSVSIVVFILCATFFYQRMSYYYHVASSASPLLLSMSGIIIMNNSFSRFSPKVLTKICCLGILLFGIGVFVYDYLKEENMTQFGVFDIIPLIVTFTFVIYIYLGERNCPYIFSIPQLGRHSMIVLVCHWPLFYIVWTICHFIENANTQIVLSIGVLTCMLLIPPIIWIFIKTRLKKLI